MKEKEWDDMLRRRAAEETISLPQSYEARLQEVYAALDQLPAQPRKRRSKVSRLLLAAALAVGCTVLLGMGTQRVLSLLSGGQLILDLDGGYSATNGEGELSAPIILEEGKLWLVADGQHLDVTERIDEETPYLYFFSSGCIAVGGTPERFGWAEWVRAEEDGPLLPALTSGAQDIYWLHDGQLYDPENLTPELQAIWDGEGSVHPAQAVYQGWYLAALDQLGLERPQSSVNGQLAS